MKQIQQNQILKSTGKLSQLSTGTKHETKMEIIEFSYEDREILKCEFYK